MDKDELQEILDNHRLWLGSEGVKADLSEADLSGARLDRANLSGANLSSTDLSGARLDGANLSGIDLSGAKLWGVDLSGVDLSGVDLSGVDLSEANLSGATLSEANLSEADFRVDKKSKILLSGNYIKNTRFAPGAKDPWNVLRRNYTGHWFAIILILTFAAIAPKAYQVLQWEREHLGPAPQMLPVKRWEVILGWSRELVGFNLSFTFFCLTILLLIYNGLRLFVTMKVQSLRYEEERSSHTPASSEYKYLWRLHRVIYPIGWIGLATILARFGFFLFGQVEVLPEALDPLK